MAAVVLPPPIDIDNDTKKAIIDGLKAVLAAFQQAGLVHADVVYQHLIAEPQILTHFVETFIANRAMVDSLVRPKEGSGPVRDDDQVLICGVSLNQIQHLLVRTCAKKVFEHDKAMETVTETVTTKSFLFFKKKEQVEVQRASNDPIEERKVRELTRYIAFGWQLPLLEAYRHYLSYQQIMEIAEDLVALTTEEHIAQAAEFDPPTLRKVKQTVGTDFADLLVHRPHAIAGIAVWNADMYLFYRRLLGDKAWDFFARERPYFNVVAALDKPLARVYGDVLCYAAAENLEEIQRLNIDKAEVLVTSLKSAFGERIAQVIAQPAFAKDILRKVVDNLLHMNQEKDKLMASYAVTCRAMVPGVMEWLSKQPRG
ncbi:MAG: hypothetical protein HY985_15610 [Magnetospirillum sp.]|nr:hypothetical protein [Magnetospirillum sp.]